MEQHKEGGVLDGIADRSIVVPGRDWTRVEDAMPGIGKPCEVMIAGVLNNPVDSAILTQFGDEIEWTYEGWVTGPDITHWRYPIGPCPSYRHG